MKKKLRWIRKNPLDFMMWNLIIIILCYLCIAYDMGVERTHKGILIPLALIGSISLICEIFVFITFFKIKKMNLKNYLFKKQIMTKFNPKNKEELTYEEALEPAMHITSKNDAQQYLADYIKYLEKFKNGMDSGDTPEIVAKANLGYFAGYFSDKVRKRVEKLFSCSHPIFGNEIPTNEEALECGKTHKTLAELRNSKK